MYDYPLDDMWSIDEIVDVMALYNAVEKAYEEGISSKDFMDAFRKYTTIVDSKSMQKQIDKAFLKASSYSIYKVYKEACEKEWVKL